MKVIARSKDCVHEFDSAADERLLYAGLRSGIELPYECGTGTCGTCKARLVAGEIADRWPVAPGRALLKRESGEFLMCQCIPVTDCVVELSQTVERLEAASPVPSHCQGIIRRATLLTRDVILLAIDTDKPLVFEAGQFMLVRVLGIAGFRAYSIVNFARGTTSIEFVVKRKPGGEISEKLFTEPVEGVELTLYGPLGKATFDPRVEKNVVCVAGGTGIAGMMSMLALALQQRYFDRFKGHVFFGVRSSQEAFFLDQLSEFGAAFRQGLKITVALSDEDVPKTYRDAYPDLRFEKGFVHEVAARYMGDWRGSVRAYIAGPPPAVEAALRLMIAGARLTPADIRYDKFT